MDTALKIFGGNPLIGTVTPIPNKNSLMAALPACILTDEPVTYLDVPNTTDVQIHLHILKLLGAEVDDSNFSKIKINCKNLNKHAVNTPLASRFRSSIMYVGPLLARFGKAKVPLPGGCLLGERAVNAHIEVFKNIGAEVSLSGNFIEFNLPKNINKNHTIWQMEASVTATENIAMFTSASDIEVQITNSACEPHVTSLLKMLINMGAKITGVGSNKLLISGNKNLKGTEFISGPDPIDIAGSIIAAALTNGEIKIIGANVPEVVDGFIAHFSPFNISIKRINNDLIVKRNGDLFIDPNNTILPLAEKGLPKFKPAPWPGFPVDALPAVVTLATKTKGRLLIQNWMYEAGLHFSHILNEIGANIFMCDPQRIIVKGPSLYKGGIVNSPGIIQACKAIFLAALCDPVETTIYGARVLNRRYPDIVNVYKSLGADIEVISR